MNATQQLHKLGQSLWLDNIALGWTTRLDLPSPAAKPVGAGARTEKVRT